jgi:hypothetical protein
MLISAPAHREQAFAKDVRPILEHRCQPCHFTGGKMYARLPFDRLETIEKLGTTKLFTRGEVVNKISLIRALSRWRGEGGAQRRVRAPLIRPLATFSPRRGEKALVAHNRAIDAKTALPPSWGNAES